MTSENYQRQAFDYYKEQSQRLLAARLPRRLVIKAGTLSALGGGSALSQLMLACTTGASQDSTVERTTAQGSYQYSKYPMIDKYNWQRLPWPKTPYVDGIIQHSGSGANNWNMLGSASLNGHGHIMDGVLAKRYGADMDMLKDEVEGHIADKWTHAPDRSYTDFHIRRNNFFHDVPPVNGRAVTAEDVKYCLDAYRTVGKDRASLAIIDRIEVLSDKETVRVHLKRPALSLEPTLASPDFWIFAPEHREGAQDRWEKQPIGTGPFKMVSQNFGSTMELVRHERYAVYDDRWQGYKRPFARAENNFALASGAPQQAAMRSKQIDYIQAQDKVEIDAMLATIPNMVVHVAAGHPVNLGAGSTWALNLRDPLFQDIRVRRALNLAIDRRTMIDSIYGGMGAGYYPISWHWLGLSDPLSPEELGPWQRYDPAQARSLLAEAGYANGFEMEFMIGSAPSGGQVAIQQYLEAVGVRVKWNQVESVVLTSARLNKNYKHAISQHVTAGFDPVRVPREWMLPDSPLNLGSIDDPILTDLVNKATYTLDFDEQRRLLGQIQDRYLDQAYMLSGHTTFRIHLRQPWFHNVTSALTGQFDIFSHHQMAVAWIDDTAPAERAGRAKT